MVRLLVTFPSKASIFELRSHLIWGLCWDLWDHSVGVVTKVPQHFSWLWWNPRYSNTTLILVKNVFRIRKTLIDYSLPALSLLTRFQPKWNDVALRWFRWCNQTNTFFAEYLDDESPIGLKFYFAKLCFLINFLCFTQLEFITSWCCNCPIHPGSEDMVSHLFLGPMYTGKEEPAPKRKLVRNSYRPTSQREALDSEKLIRTRLSDAHDSDPLRFVRWASSILDHAGIKSLVMALLSRRVTTVENLSVLLN